MLEAILGLLLLIGLAGFVAMLWLFVIMMWNEL